MLLEGVCAFILLRIECPLENGPLLRVMVSSAASMSGGNLQGSRGGLYLEDLAGRTEERMRAIGVSVCPLARPWKLPGQRWSPAPGAALLAFRGRAVSPAGALPLLAKVTSGSVHWDTWDVPWGCVRARARSSGGMSRVSPCFGVSCGSSGPCQRAELYRAHGRSLPWASACSAPQSGGGDREQEWAERAGPLWSGLRLLSRKHRPWGSRGIRRRGGGRCSWFEVFRTLPHCGKVPSRSHGEWF